METSIPDMTQVNIEHINIYMIWCVQDGHCINIFSVAPAVKKKKNEAP